MPYYAVFEGTIFQGKEDVSNNYYTTLESHLRQQPGLVEEVNYVNGSALDSMLLSSWVDDQALSVWQKLPVHLQIQVLAREKVFSSYRIRLGWDSYPTAPQTTKNAGHFMTLYQRKKDGETTATNQLHELLREPSEAKTVFNSMLDHTVWWTESHVLHVLGWPDDESAAAFESGVRRVAGDYLRRVRVVRDYTKTDRSEAPQAA